MGQNKNQYTYDGTNNIGAFLDPGATAEDYLDDHAELTQNIKKKVTFGTTILCNENILTNPACDNPIDIEVPGIYTITYSVTTKRGAKADDKQRTITVAPPKVGKLTAEAGKSTIAVDDVFLHVKAVTTVNLYNTYEQLIESIPPSNDGTVLFTEIPAGLGYYVTQTVNGVESAPSNPINVTLFETANEAALITSFEFALERAIGVIDHKAGTIEVVVPKDTVITSLKAKFEATGSVKVNNVEQISGNTPQNFSSPVKYTVTPADGKQPKDYIVTVTKESFKTEAWTTTVRKAVSFSLAGSTHTLLPNEVLEGKKKALVLLAKTEQFMCLLPM